MSGEKNGNILTALFAFFIGTLVGSSLSLLFAPWSGKETREKIRDTSVDVKDRTLDVIDSAKEQTVETVESTKDRVGEVVESTKDRVSDLIDQGKDHLDSKMESVSSAVESGKQAFNDKKDQLLARSKVEHDGTESVEEIADAPA